MEKLPLILVVEDLEDNRDFITQVLSGSYELIFAVDGRSAITLAKAKKPDMIIMDINLPVLNGWEATKLLRMDAKFKQTPIIALTAYTSEADRKLTFEAGCNEFVNKPVMPNDLRTLIKKYIP